MAFNLIIFLRFFQNIEDRKFYSLFLIFTQNEFLFQRIIFLDSLKPSVNKNNYKEYKWTWCGRYSIPFGLMTSYYLQNLYDIKLTGSLVGYAASIDRPHVPVDDLGMGTSAPANIRHWVGYTAVGYK